MIEAAARDFVLTEAGFAQVTTIDRRGFPVARTMTAFLADGWAVDLVQRREHTRIAQWRRDPHTTVTWVGSPAPGATNERPHVFDLSLLPPRVVSIRGTAEEMPAEWTVRRYLEELVRLRARGGTRAPVRGPEQVEDELVGIRIHPVRVRLEGFGTGAESFTFDC
ncbi:pyridoxamine 5'-phosphate oxidase family protein [Pseudonocardia adelaidensis]|uniref:Pyridoxamine 5'-phosphate oxidase n=1 Tax=Pseudonocardia adelaidensis TaxID=648754 RepID=A0ABP9NWK3_9PSEU